MARKRKGRDISGWLVIDKPAGMTSTAVVNKVRWAFDAKKAGHAGTLDPGATGLLAVALGEATKTVPYVTDAMKAYEFTIRLGQSTTTDDAEGEIVAESAVRPTDEEIKEALHPFAGEVMQVPPAYSAVKVQGERAYDLAREGDAPELAARPLWIEELVLVDRPDADHAQLEMTCGKGGYVRSVARDLGAALGCHAHVVSLRRLWSGPFSLDQAMPFAALDEEAKSDSLDRFLLPLEAGLGGLPEMRVPEASLGKLRNGNPAPVIGSGVDYGAECWASHDGRAIAVGRWMGGEMHPGRVFVQ